MSGREEFIALSPAQQAQFDWLSAAPLVKIIDALEKVEKGSARFVGGCVRDSLLGEKPKDFDIAATLTPEAVTQALRAAGLRAAPTGIEHGTVTAIVDHKGVEVTTLRADLSTDGRRANVKFTRNWAEDARRRDFTINAIYLTPQGKLYDPVGGVADAAAACVRFIGEPRARIGEDYLRILRFFRFSARFSTSFDEDGLAACAAQRRGMARLSAERIGAETAVILALPRAAFALRAMAECGVLDEIWRAPANIDAAARLKEIAPSAPAAVVLAVLYGAAGAGIGARLRMSKAERARRARTLDALNALEPALSDAKARALIYGFGAEAFGDGAAAACALGVSDQDEYERLARLARSWKIPTLPISGRHIIAAGVAAGPKVAQILAAVEARWIAEDFPSHERVSAILAEQIAAAS
jgi:poly(A) polymerase